MRSLRQLADWIRNHRQDLLSLTGGVLLALIYLWWWAHGERTTLLDRVFRVALGVSGAVAVAMLAAVCGMWLTLSKGTRFDAHIRELAEVAGPWAASKARRAGFIVLGFALVALLHADFMASFYFGQAALWFIALRTFTLAVIRGSAGMSTRAAIAVGYLAGTFVAIALPHSLIL